MTTQETAYAEIERLVKRFKDMLVRVYDEIDRRMYVLYGLTEEEVKIVEG